MQLGRSSWQPPKWIMVDPSGLLAAVTLLTPQELRSLGSNPAWLYTEIHQKVSTGTRIR